MKRNKYIALIGHIGSGKSTVLRIIKNNGYQTISSDEITSKLWFNKTFVDLLKRNFPDATINGEITKSSLAKIVFNNPDELSKLNDITHPIIKDIIFEKKAVDGVVFVELTAPDFMDNFDEVWSVVSEDQLTIDRVGKRNGSSIEEIKSRLCSQQKYNDLISKAQVIIHNSSDIISLENIVLEELKLLEARSKR